MTDHQSQEHASRELDAILNDMDWAGAGPRRAAKRIRKAVDCLLMAQDDGPIELPVELAVDMPRVTADMATQLVVHHLALAAAYYEASGPDLDLVLARARKADHKAPDLSLTADRAWLREMGRRYREFDGEPQEEGGGE